MKRLLNMLTRCFVILIFSSCSLNERAQENYKRTIVICDNLYVEVFTSYSSGAYGGDLVNNYLTDSLNFRFLIGDYDEIYGGYYYECDGDTLIVNKIKKLEVGLQGTIIDQRKYSRSKLKVVKNINGNNTIQTIPSDVCY